MSCHFLPMPPSRGEDGGKKGNISASLSLTSRWTMDDPPATSESTILALGVVRLKVRRGEGVGGENRDRGSFYPFFRGYPLPLFRLGKVYSMRLGQIWRRITSAQSCALNDPQLLNHKPQPQGYPVTFTFSFKDVESEKGLLLRRLQELTYSGTFTTWSFQEFNLWEKKKTETLFHSDKNWTGASSIIVPVLFFLYFFMSPPR